MKKSLVALAVLVFTGAVSAQSSLTIYGVADVAVEHGKGTITSRTRLITSGQSSSRLGFLGTEDLGGGFAASFLLEAGLEIDNGQGIATNSNNQTTGIGAASAGRQGITFNRRSTVSFHTPYGELRLGRDHVPQFWNLTLFDPYSLNGVGANQNIVTIVTGTESSVRASNGIGYILPAKLGGIYGQAQYYLGENPQNGAANEKDGTGYGFRLGYAAGPFNIALGHGRTNFAAGAAPARTGNTRQSNIGASWDFGVAKVQGVVTNDRNGADTGKGYLIGSLIPVGSGVIRLSYSQYELDVGAAADPRTRKLAVGYVHNLSKRTALYTTYARLKNNGGANQALGNATTAPNASSSGLDVGIRHSF